MSEQSDLAYDAETAVLAGLALIPGVGGSLAVVAERTARRTRENIAEAGQAALSEAGDANAFIEGLRTDERLGYLFLSACEGAARTALAQKRRLLGILVGRAVHDDAQVDESELMLTVLRDLEGPHVRALSELGDLPPWPSDGSADESDRRTEVIHATRDILANYPAPVAATLLRSGVVRDVEGYDRNYPAGLNSFGEKLLADLRDAGDDGIP